MKQQYQVQMIMGGQVLECGKSWPVENGNYAKAHKEADRLNNAGAYTRYFPAWFVVKVA